MGFPTDKSKSTSYIEGPAALSWRFGKWLVRALFEAKSTLLNYPTQSAGLEVLPELLALADGVIE
jgi:hypothetical protein